MGWLTMSDEETRPQLKLMEAMRNRLETVAARAGKNSIDFLEAPWCAYSRR